MIQIRNNKYCKIDFIMPPRYNMIFLFHIKEERINIQNYKVKIKL